MGAGILQIMFERRSQCNGAFPVLRFDFLASAGFLPGLARLSWPISSDREAAGGSVLFEFDLVCACSRSSAHTRTSEVNEIEEGDPQTYTIAIPALDPGRDKYGSQPQSLRRVMLQTLMVDIAILDLVRTTTVTAISRADAINRALAVWNTAEPYRRLAKALEDAKTQLQEVWSSINFRVGRTELSAEEHAVRSFKAQTRSKTFVAEGAAISPEHQTQPLGMWRLN
ncbi:hypothetical protein CF319_g7460 [Tilletia indica]|nr:hypothetical protein CF319_g7460 [Tilletia indica]